MLIKEQLEYANQAISSAVARFSDDMVRQFNDCIPDYEKAADQYRREFELTDDECELFVCKHKLEKAHSALISMYEANPSSLPTIIYDNGTIACGSVHSAYVAMDKVSKWVNQIFNDYLEKKVRWEEHMARQICPA